MREFLFDLRDNLFLLVGKIVLTLLVATCFYNVASIALMQGKTAADALTAYNGTELFGLIDTLDEGDGIQKLFESRQLQTAVASFYDSLSSQENAPYLAIADHPVYSTETSLPKKYHWSYGTDMSDNGVYNDESGREVIDIKGLQLNERAFDFFNLQISEGEPISWDSVDYSTGTVPVLLGAEYREVHNIGDTIKAGLYYTNLEFKVIGFLSPNATVYVDDDAGINHSLDSSIVIPYPEKLSHAQFIDNDQKAITSSQMLTGYFVSKDDDGAQSAIAALDHAAMQSGFHSYTLLQASEFSTQNYLTRNLVEHNVFLIAVMLLFLITMCVIAIEAANSILGKRRALKVTIWHTLGKSNASIRQRLFAWKASGWVLTLMAMTLVIAQQPNQSMLAYLLTVCLLALIWLAELLADRIAKHEQNTEVIHD